MGQGYIPTFSLTEAKNNPKKVLVKYNENGMAVPVEDAPNWENQQKEANKILKF